MGKSVSYRGNRMYKDHVDGRSMVALFSVYSSMIEKALYTLYSSLDLT